MKKRFIGPPNPGVDDAGKPVDDVGHEVLVAGRKFGTVRSGEVLDIPDEAWGELVAEHEAADCPLPEWSADLWEDVRTSARKKGEGE